MSRKRAQQQQYPVVMLSGHMAAGKSTLARTLAEQYGYRTLTSRSVMALLVPESAAYSRAELQELGVRLDQQTGNSWMAQGLAAEMNEEPGRNSPIAVDSVRSPQQSTAVRVAAWRMRRPVVHVHIEVPGSLRAQRFADRDGETPGTQYSAAAQHQSERAIDGLAEVADLTVDGTLPPGEIAQAVDERARAAVS